MVRIVANVSLLFRWTGTYMGNEHFWPAGFGPGYRRTPPPPGPALFVGTSPDPGHHWGGPLHRPLSFWSCVHLGQEQLWPAGARGHHW